MGEKGKWVVSFQWEHECAFCFSFFSQTHCQSSAIVISIVFVRCTSLCWEWPDKTPPSYSKELFALCIQNHIFFINWSRFLLFFSTWQPFRLRGAVEPWAGLWSALCIPCATGNYAGFIAGGTENRGIEAWHLYSKEIWIDCGEQ